MKLSFKGITKPTPAEIEKAANAFLVGTVFITATTIYAHHEWIALIWAHLGAVAKMISVFFSEDAHNDTTSSTV